MGYKSNRVSIFAGDYPRALIPCHPVSDSDLKNRMLSDLESLRVINRDYTTASGFRDEEGCSVVEIAEGLQARLEAETTGEVLNGITWEARFLLTTFPASTG